MKDKIWKSTSIYALRDIFCKGIRYLLNLEHTILLVKKVCNLILKFEHFYILKTLKLNMTPGLRKWSKCVMNRLFYSPRSPLDTDNG